MKRALWAWSLVVLWNLLGSETSIALAGPLMVAGPDAGSPITNSTETSAPTSPPPPPGPPAAKPEGAAAGGGAPEPPKPDNKPTPDPAGPPGAKPNYADPVLSARPNPIVGLYRDRWQIYPMLFAQLDASVAAGRGVSGYQRADGSGLNPGADVRRVRLGFRGSVLDRVYYQFLAELGGTNSGGPNQTFAFRGGLVDAFVAWRFSEAVALRFGQFSVPLTFENTRAPPSWDMLEGSRTSFIAVPNIAKDIGLAVHGAPGPFWYAVGLFNGEGQRRAAVDDQGDVVGRFAVRFNRTGENRGVIGVSGRWGAVDPASTFADAPLPGLSTDRGYQFWANTYQFAEVQAPAPPTTVRVLPSGSQRAVGLDGLLELGDFDLQADALYLNYGRREVTQQQPDVDETLRTGELRGLTYYVTANYWITRPSKILKAIRFEPLHYNYQREIPADEFKPVLALMARWEQLFLEYDSTARSPGGVERGLLDLYSRKVRMDALHIHLALWASFRFRLGLQWSIYNFPGDTLSDRRVDNQALAPGAVIAGERGTRARSDIPPNVSFGDPLFYTARDIDSRILHEVGARVQVLLP